MQDHMWYMQQEIRGVQRSSVHSHGRHDRAMILIGASLEVNAALVAAVVWLWLHVTKNG